MWKLSHPSLLTGCPSKTYRLVPTIAAVMICAGDHLAPGSV